MSGTAPPPPDAPIDDGPATPTDRAPGRRGGPAGDGVAARAYDRVPPHSLDAEVSVLGAALLSRAAASEVTELLDPDDFYRSAHRVVFEGIRALMDVSEPIDTVTLTDWLGRNDRLDEVGGPAALHDLTVATPTAANAAYYARIVQQKALLRRLIDAGTAVTRMGYEAVDEAEQVVDRAESLIYEVSQVGSRNEYTQLRDLLNQSFEAIERLAEQGSEVTGLATGFDDLDRLTSGLQPQNLVILAARPAMGKCLWGEARVLEVKSGRLRSIADVVAAGSAGEPVQVAALDDYGRLVAVDVDQFHDNGVAPVYRLHTRSGRRITATAQHPFRTWSEWTPLSKLEPGTRIAVPRELPWFGDHHLPDGEVKLLAYLLGDGCLTKSAPELTTESHAVARDAAAAAGCFGVDARVVDKPGSRAWTLAFRPAHPRVTQTQVAKEVGCTPARAGVVLRRGEARTELDRRILEAAEALVYTGGVTNVLQERLGELKLLGSTSRTKFVPDEVHSLGREQLALFLSRLFATDGSAWVAERHGYFGISYCSVSDRLIHDVQHLLLRFGVLSRIRDRQVRYRDGHRCAFELEIRDAANCRRFLTEIGIFSKEEQCAKLLEFAERRGVVHTNTDLLPREVWDDILQAKGARSWADVSAATGRPRNHNWHVGMRRPSRRLVAELAEALDSDHLRDVSSSDVLWDEIVSIEPAGEEQVYDLTVPGLHNFVADDLVVHNSSLVLNLAQYVSVEVKKPSIIFSLEMSKIEIVNRMLSAEARIESSKLRTGKLDDLDWRKLGDALGKLSDAPLFIDDTPSITLMEIRAKCRRLKQRHGLDLVVVDYLQLMSSGARVDSRQQEVAEFSRGLKMLAKELDVPVIALSQLSRQPEARTDKRPMMSDLRESGCLTRETRLFRADNGRPITFGELLDQDLHDVPVWATDERGEVVPARLTHAFPSGVKPTFRVTMRSGLTVEATANHPFRTLDGWTPLGELRVGGRIAAARRLPEPAEPRSMDPDELVLLAHLIGDGTTVARQPVHYTSADEANLDAVAKAAWQRFGIEAVRRPDGRSATTTQLYLPAPFHLTHGRRNPIAAWLDGLGCWDRRAFDKQLPVEVFALPREQVRDFLHHLWATDGSLHVRPDGAKGPKVGLYYATSSRQLAADVQLLLRRIDIRARVGTYAQRSGRPGHQVAIFGAEQQRRFLEEVGVHGERGASVERALAVLADVTSNPNTDVLPREIWDRVRARRRELGMTERAFQAAIGTQYRGSTLYRSAPSRRRLAVIAAALTDPVLAQLSVDDLHWDEIVAIEPIGDREVFDATVAGHHNFIAEGLVLHNSLEQDADIVAFIYRDEVYDADTPDKGLAELIVSKHRNGATGVVKLAFLNHLTKFANLARGNSGGSGGGGAGGAPTPI